MSLKEASLEARRIEAYLKGSGQIFCFMCGATVPCYNYTPHLKKCYQTIEKALKGLPPDLKKPMPSSPSFDSSPSGLKRFNDTARRTYFENVMVWCAICDQRLHPTVAFAHYDSHMKMASNVTTKVKEKIAITEGKAHPSTRQDAPAMPTVPHPSIPLFEKVRRMVLGHGGPCALQSLRRMICTVSLNRGGRITGPELDECLHAHGTALKRKDLDTILSGLSSDEYKSVDAHEVIQRIRGAISEDRFAMIESAYDRLDPYNSNRCTVREMLLAFDAKRHPNVCKGSRTEEEEKQQLRLMFLPKRKEDKVSRRDFVDMYTDMSCAIPRDEDFRNLMSVWDRDDPRQLCRVRMVSDGPLGKLFKDEQSMTTQVQTRAASADPRVIARRLRADGVTSLKRVVLMH